MYASEKHPGGVTVMLWSPPKLGTPRRICSSL
nr:MAG TPA: hypothetical protein [Caudoviricetes sp.]